MTTTETETKLRAADKRALIALTAKINAGQEAAHERARLIDRLHDDGHSYSELGRVMGISKQATSLTAQRRRFL